jgi:hypothetical protein
MDKPFTQITFDFGSVAAENVIISPVESAIAEQVEEQYQKKK